MRREKNKSKNGTSKRSTYKMICINNYYYYYLYSVGEWQRRRRFYARKRREKGTNSLLATDRDKLLARIHQLRLAHAALKLAELMRFHTYLLSRSLRKLTLHHIFIPTHVRMAAMCCEHKTMSVSRSLRSLAGESLPLRFIFRFSFHRL